MVTNNLNYKRIFQNARSSNSVYGAAITVLNQRIAGACSKQVAACLVRNRYTELSQKNICISLKSNNSDNRMVDA